MSTFDPDQITFFAKTDARGQEVPFGIKAKDRQRHMYVIGKTGMGKSTLLENMAAQDIQNGEGMAFIDPHGSAAETLLDYVPEHRIKDVVYFAPYDLDNPVSFNVMEDVGADKRHLVVSGLMSTFKKIWVDAWSARMEYILTNALLVLIEYPDTTLLSVNRLFNDKAYRQRVVEYCKDPAVKSFWVDEYANYTERFAAEALPAIQNKIGQFTGNPLIRNIIGQPHSSFNIRELMDERKILIMNLSKGLIGETNANLLGSMLTTRIYLAAMSRADLAVDVMRTMPNFYFYVDEFQSFANSTFANILSEARKYHLNLIIAHQYVAQMEEEVRDAVFGNVGTTIAFRVGPFDAEVLETVYAPRFEAVDLVNLGFAQIYLTLMIDGIGSQPFSAQTLPPVALPPVSCKGMVIESSRQLYAKSRPEVEQLVQDLHTPERPPAKKAPQKSTNRSGPPNRPKSDGPPQSGNNGSKPPPKQPGGAECTPDDLKSILAGIAQKEAKTTTNSATTQTKPGPKPDAPAKASSESGSKSANERNGQNGQSEKNGAKADAAAPPAERPARTSDVRSSNASLDQNSSRSNRPPSKAESKSRPSDQSGPKRDDRKPSDGKPRPNHSNTKSSDSKRDSKQPDAKREAKLAPRSENRDALKNALSSVLQAASTPESNTDAPASTPKPDQPPNKPANSKSTPAPQPAPAEPSRPPAGSPDPDPAPAQSEPTPAADTSPPATPRHSMFTPRRISGEPPAPPKVEQPTPAPAAATEPPADNESARSGSAGQRDESNLDPAVIKRMLKHHGNERSPFQ